MTFIEQDCQITKNFKASEFKCKDKCGKIYIAKELVEKLQELRDHFEKPINVSSGYRCISHNKAIGSTSGSDSPHCMGLAADICVSGHTSEEVAIVAEQLGFDGIAYINDNYIHLDLKGRKWYADERTGKTFKTFQKGVQADVKHRIDVLIDGKTVYSGEV